MRGQIKQYADHKINTWKGFKTRLIVKLISDKFFFTIFKCFSLISRQNAFAMTWKCILVDFLETFSLKQWKLDKKVQKESYKFIKKIWRFSFSDRFPRHAADYKRRHYFSIEGLGNFWGILKPEILQFCTAWYCQYRWSYNQPNQCMVFFPSRWCR